MIKRLAMKRLATGVLPLCVVACLVLGGASNGGFWANLVLQMGAILLLVWSFWTPALRRHTRPERFLALLIVGAGLVALLQFLPLPTSLWEMLPGRGEIASVNRIAGIDPAWMLLGLFPHQALAALLWTLPSLAALAFMLRREPYHGRWLAVAIVTVMVVSVVVSALQLSGGPQSPLYFYEITNRGSAVGFFANSNHQASLLLVSIPFLAALGSHCRRLAPGPRLAGLAVLAVAGVLVLVGVYVNGSLAGYGLALPVLGASIVILVPTSPLRRWIPMLLVPLVASGLAVLLLSHDGQQLLAQGTGVSSGTRDVIFARTWRAVGDFFPIGSGLGSFAEVYRTYEPVHGVDWAHVNHAHNDYLELLLETGLAGGIVIAGFLAWWGARAARIWVSLSSDSYALAGVIASATLLIHSLVDYPLRTAGLSVVFAICCALMTRWATGDPLPFERRQGRYFDCGVHC